MFGASGAREQQLGLAAERECYGFEFVHVSLPLCPGACRNWLVSDFNSRKAIKMQAHFRGARNQVLVSPVSVSEATGRNFRE